MLKSRAESIKNDNPYQDAHPKATSPVNGSISRNYNKSKSKQAESA